MGFCWTAKLTQPPTPWTVPSTWTLYLSIIPIKQSRNQPIKRSINESSNQPINQSINQSISQSINQSSKETANQSINRAFVNESVICYVLFLLLQAIFETNFHQAHFWQKDLLHGADWASGGSGFRHGEHCGVMVVRAAVPESSPTAGVVVKHAGFFSQRSVSRKSCIYNLPKKNVPRLFFF